MKLSVVIPAYNEEKNIGHTLEEIQKVLWREKISYEIIAVNDNSKDGTKGVIQSFMDNDQNIKTVDRKPPGGFGRAIRSGLELVQGDVVIIYMADLSDDPEDLIKYYRKIEEGYDCVFGSRFGTGSRVEHYPKGKLIANRIINKIIQLMFWTKHNDLTNAFKAYRTHVIKECGPFQASHFNITIEMSINALIRNYSIAKCPINWYGRTWGESNLKIGEMGRRYLSVLLKLFFERTLISDDLIADRLSMRASEKDQLESIKSNIDSMTKRIETLEEKVNQ